MSSELTTIPKIGRDQFLERFDHEGYLHEGADGSVSKWTNSNEGTCVAIKEPKPNREHMLREEIATFSKVRSHEHIVQLMGVMEDWSPTPPALILELAHLGDVEDYRRLVLRSREHERVPEQTLWKLMRDMSKGLDWLHNHCGQPYVHGDLKPQNMLVFLPKGARIGDVPLLPTFKVCDIGRMMPAPEGNSLRFNGTPEYGPPFQERLSSQAAAVDIWSLAASIQFLALGVTPRMSNSDFIVLAREQYNREITEQELRDNYRQWRQRIPPLYRPLDLSTEEQRDVLKLENPVPPYSTLFNNWYKQLYRRDATRRYTSATLARDFVPAADLYISMMDRRWIHVENEEELQTQRDTLAEAKTRYQEAKAKLQEARRRRQPGK